MKNCKFSPGHYLALRHGRWLSFAVLFLLASCHKDTELTAYENSSSITPSGLSTTRSSGLESDVVQYAQWMLKYVVPLVKDPLAYEDIKAGNYGTARVQAKLGSLGFSSFSSFANQFAAKGSTVNEAIKSGVLSRESLAQFLKLHLSDLDMNTLMRQGGSPGAPSTPCYDQLMDHLALVAIDVALGSFYGPWGAVAAGVMGVTVAYIAFNNCLDENYPNG